MLGEVLPQNKKIKYHYLIVQSGQYSSGLLSFMALLSFQRRRLLSTDIILINSVSKQNKSFWEKVGKSKCISCDHVERSDLI